MCFFLESFLYSPCFIAYFRNSNFAAFFSLKKKGGGGGEETLEGLRFLRYFYLEKGFFSPSKCSAYSKHTKQMNNPTDLIKQIKQNTSQCI